MTGFLASLVQLSDSPFFICIISTRKSDMALAHWWCPALVWLHTFLYMSFLFSTEDIAGMSCEIDVLFRRLSIYRVSVLLQEAHKSSCFRVPFVIPVGSCWTCLKTSEVGIISTMVMHVLSISDMAESELPLDVTTFLTSKLATTAELS